MNKYIEEYDLDSDNWEFRMKSLGEQASVIDKISEYGLVNESWPRVELNYRPLLYKNSALPLSYWAKINNQRVNLIE